MSKELLYKVLLVGDVGTGKTSIVQRYVHGAFSAHQKATVGVDFGLKVIKWDENVTVRLQIWDIAGQERFGKMTRVYYQDGVAALVVFDATRQSTFEATKKWKSDIDSKVTLPNGDPIPVILLANKIDLVEEGEGWGKTSAEMDQICKTEGYLAWFQTSAKENVGLDAAGRALVQEIIQKVGDTLEKDDDSGVDLSAPKKTNNDCC